MAEEALKKEVPNKMNLKIHENPDDYNNCNRKTSNEKETDTYQQEEKSTKDEQKDENSKYIEKALSLYNKSLTILKSLIYSDNKNKENIKIILENYQKEIEILYSNFEKRLENSKTEEEKEKIYISYREDLKELRNYTMKVIKNVNSDKGIGIGLVIGIFIGATIGIPTGIAIYKKFN